MYHITHTFMAADCHGIKLTRTKKCKTLNQVTNKNRNFMHQYILLSLIADGHL